MTGNAVYSRYGLMMTNNEWDDYAEEWDSNASTAEYADNAFRELTQAVKLDDLRVFDFGCGTGLLAERLSPHVDKVVALDGARKMIEQLKFKALPNVFPIADFLTTDLIKNNALMNAKFDLVTASSVCAFLPDYEATLLLLKSLLVSGGIYVQWDWFSTDESSEMGFTERKVSQSLNDAGFINISLTQPFTIENSNGKMPVLMVVGKSS